MSSIKKRLKIGLIVGLIFVLVVVIFGVIFILPQFSDSFRKAYNENCSSCHATDLAGAPLGPALVGVDLKHGETVREIARSISDGYPATGMPAYANTLNPTEIKKIAIYVSEQRNNYTQEDFKLDIPLVVPEGVIESEDHAFRLETVATGIHRWPYSIAPLPDGRILLSEKTRGLSIISRNGEQSELIKDIPEVYDDGKTMGILYGTGWALDVAIHPDYENNGWIYLSHGDRLVKSDPDRSMCKLLRGRIQNGRWVDEETIWQAKEEAYTTDTEVAMGGRICFDNKGYVFLSVGVKKSSFRPMGNMELYPGVQDLTLPYGKIYRIHEDGRIPEDNPFVDVPDALKAIWTYGHRCPQGLEINPSTGELWGTEMGPRGGDEVNRLLPGRNYGWPLHSKGLNYNGSEVPFGKYLGIELDLADIEQPVVDLTPSPAVSSFVFYEGDVFPEWQGNLIVGTLKATELYRMELKGNEVIHRETLLKDLARIRDIEVGPDGNIYLLLEHASGAQIVRMVSVVDSNIPDLLDRQQ